MNILKDIREVDASFPSRPLVCAILATLGLVAEAQPVVDNCCWRVTSDTTLTSDKTERCVEVVSGVTLTISGCTLTLDGANGCDKSTVSGSIVLENGSSALHFTSNSHTVTGSGSIDGEDPNALIEIGDGLTLTSTTTIEGSMQIVGAVGGGTTSFVNSSGPGNTGLVHANDAGTLELNVDSLGSPAGDWRVSTSSSAVLKFSVGSTGMSGRFDVAAGTLDIDANVTTSGDLDFTGGTIDVAAGVTFQAGS